MSENIQQVISKALEENPKVVATATFGYFAYVVLGGIDHDLHKHIYTGDENDSVITRLKKGSPVTFR